MTDRTIGPKTPPPKPLFSERKWKFGRWKSADIKQAAEQHQVPLLQGSILLVPKMGQCPKPTMPRPYTEFYWALLYQVLKIWAKFTWPI